MLLTATNHTKNHLVCNNVSTDCASCELCRAVGAFKQLKIMLTSSLHLIILFSYISQSVPDEFGLVIRIL